MTYISVNLTHDDYRQYDIKLAHDNGLKLMKGRTFHKQVFNRPKGFDLCVH